jgi:hypothetical protein
MHKVIPKKKAAPISRSVEDFGNENWKVEKVNDDDDSDNDNDLENDAFDDAEYDINSDDAASVVSSPGGKRKRMDSVSVPDGKNLKKKQKFEQLKEKRKNFAKSVGTMLDSNSLDRNDANINERMMHLMDSKLQAAGFTRLYSHFLAESKQQITELELESKGLNGSCFVDIKNSGVVVNKDDAHKLKYFAAHVKSVFKDWKQTLCGYGGNGNKGSPSLLIITHSFERTMLFYKEVKKLGVRKQQIVKAFSHRMKLSQQLQELKVNVRVCCGTPCRMLKLIDAGGLSLQDVEYVIVDCQPNEKQFNIFTMQQIRNDFFSLFHKHLFDHIQESNRNKRGKLLLF